MDVGKASDCHSVLALPIPVKGWRPDSLLPLHMLTVSHFEAVCLCEAASTDSGYLRGFAA